ncbi:FtsK/SpoIIIE domain-containing protein [Micromonospora sp. WMMD1102]|uniref:FtsK/SpoIIIE domain-containing protein n=1 Tax=Micromonospora sp. WMMD1102 TaxID=3016105 RepID=UPI0024151F17|nr:FtsK/SpoIIIE domain-containing protein [Micromonospora sp. WMMD1102]MDG4791041.1 FtsK/SpoIIIE domain-containing protein [Micromonospora sp. WMMD1102]
MIGRPRGEVVMTSAGDLMVIRPKRLELPLWLVIPGLLLRWGWRALWWCLRHPVATASTAFLLTVYLDHGWQGLVTLLVLVGGVSAVWRWRHEASWWTWFAGPLLGWFRRVTVYRRVWREAVTLCGLAERFDHQTVLPRLLSVRSDPALDVLAVRMVRGQTPEDFQRVTSNLAYAFGRRHARVYSEHPDDRPTRSGRWAWLLRAVDAVRFRDRPSVVYLVLVRTDALRAVVPPFDVPAVPDFTALPLARRDDLSTWCLHLLATHVLVGGATRRGKGSVLWSLVRALGGGVASGLVRLWVIDPKGGMEFAMGRPMFARFACKSFEAMADLLDEAVTVMRERQARLAGAVRVHTPTVADPLVVVVIDEMAALTAYLQDVELRKRIAASLGLLLSQGAGVGVLVVAALQDPRKEVLPFRDLFPTRIALGLTEASQVDMVLGDGARDRGALADQMPRWAKGVGYVILDGTPEPARVRFSYISDDEIRAMATRFPAPVDAADILAQVGRETAPEPTRPSLPRQRSSGPLLPDALLNLLRQDPDKDGGEQA